MKKLLFLVALICMGASQVRADEGMWLPSEILKKIKDIQSQGFKLSAEDISVADVPANLSLRKVCSSPTTIAVSVKSSRIAR